MLKKLYEQITKYAAHPQAELVLFIMAVAESSFFPVPPDVLLIPMVIVNFDRAFRYAFIATAGSVIGGVIGYYIGYLFQDTIGQGIIAFYGIEDKFEQFKVWYDEFDVFIVGIAGVTPIPYKIVTIASGLLHANLPSFIMVSILSRGFRFFLIAWLLWRGGASFKGWIEKNLYPITMAAGIILILVIVLWKFLF